MALGVLKIKIFVQDQGVLGTFTAGIATSEDKIFLGNAEIDQKENFSR